MDKKLMTEVLKVGGNHIANLLAGNAKNIDLAFEDAMVKNESGKASIKVLLALRIQKNTDGATGGVKVSAELSGKVPFKNSTEPETIDTHPKLPGIDKAGRGRKTT